MSSGIVSGKIEKINISEGVTKGKGWKRVTLKIDGSENLYSTFRAEILDRFSEGDEVSLEYEKAGKFYNIVKIINQEVIEAQVNQINTEPVEPKSVQTKWDLKDKRIARLACLNTANALLNNFIQLNPETAKKAYNEGKDLREALKRLAENLELWVYRDQPG